MRWTLAYMHVNRLGTNLPRQNVHTSVNICQPKSSPLCNIWRSGSTSLQNKEIWTTMFLVPLDGTHCRRPCMTHHWHWPGSVHSCRPYYKTLPWHLRDTLGCKDCCANTNVLTYVTSYSGQLSLAIPLWLGTLSTNETWDVDTHINDATRMDIFLSITNCVRKFFTFRNVAIIQL